MLSKVLLALVAVLHLQGIWIHHYLDDILVLADSEMQVRAHCDQVLSILELFGWLITEMKSHLSPCQKVVYLGASLDTVRVMVSLAEEMIIILMSRVSWALDDLFILAFICKNIFGTMVAGFSIVRWVQWHSRIFQMGFLYQWDMKHQSVWLHFHLPRNEGSLLLWMSSENLRNCHLLLHPRCIIVETDTSSYRLGGILPENFG